MGTETGNGDRVWEWGQRLGMGTGLKRGTGNENMGMGHGIRI